MIIKNLNEPVDPLFYRSGAKSAFVASIGYFAIPYSLLLLSYLFAKGIAGFIVLYLYFLWWLFPILLIWLSIRFFYKKNRNNSHNRKYIISNIFVSIALSLMLSILLIIPMLFMMDYQLGGIDSHKIEKYN